MLKVKETTATETETSATIEIPGLEILPRSAARQLKRDVGDFLIESILDSVADSRSPVSGERWPALSREYKKRKVDEGAPPVANLDLRGDLLEALDFEETDGGIKLGFFGDQAPKADGHLKFSGKEGTAPKRRSIPAEGQKFVSSIESEVEAMVAEAVAETIEPDASDFESVETASEFWEAIADYFPEMSRTKVKMTVLNSPSLTDFFESLGLMRFLK